MALVSRTFDAETTEMLEFYEAVAARTDPQGGRRSNEQLCASAQAPLLPYGATGCDYLSVLD
jgi:hypothetical protein